jgi:2-amino-4-hydroxy-6-hydroxymethyldihydropteridine diphosphokinase
MQRDGFTIVPTKMYFKKGKAKIELAVAKGKKQFDKRATKKIEIGTVIKLDTSGKQARITYLGIGSNLGNKKDNIEKAKSLLIENNVNLISVSSYYNTPSWPNPKNPDFINIVAKAKCAHEPEILLGICKSIESKLGRKKTPKNSPRECDIDIVDFDRIIRRNGLILPHKMMHIRNFVLIPLFEIEKNWTHPITKNNIKKLIFSLPNKDIRSIKQI